MSEEIKELKETLERSLQNPLLIDREKTERFYKGIINLQQKVEQLENIRKETIKFILQNCEIIRHEKENVDEVGRVNGADLLNILNKGE